MEMGAASVLALSLVLAPVFIVAVRLAQVRRATANGTWPSVLDDGWGWDLKVIDNLPTPVNTSEAVAALRAMHQHPPVVWWSALSLPGLAAIALYQMFLRPTHHYRLCNFYPGCSSFAAGCLRRFPPHAAIGMAIRRLRRCDGSCSGLALPGLDLVVHDRPVCPPLTSHPNDMS